MSYRQRKLRRTRRRPRYKSKALLGVLVVLVCIIIAGLAGVGYIIAIAATGPDLDELKPVDKGESSAVYAADGSLLGYVQSDIVRQPKSFDYMPPELRQATVAIEDERFYEHGGVDPEGIVRAAVKNVTSGSTVQGGSTITQQLVRALYIQDPQRDYKRKIREAKLAQELEDKHSKRWILEQYMNDVPYGTVGGRTALGAEAASQVFFAKHASKLTLDQAALLAGLPQAPSQYNPFQNPQAAVQRRNEVLQKMSDNGFISQSRANAAMQKGLGLKRGNLYTKRREPYFFDYVEQLLIERYGVGVYRKGGLKVYTTIDPALQKAGRETIDRTLYLKTDPASAIVSIDPHNGYIRAMASSGTYNDRTFNLAAQGHRQPGSTFKTMVLTTAILQGVDPEKTYYTSKPLHLQIPGYGTWNVKTYGGTYQGTVNLVKATLTSDNSVYAQLDVDLGPKKVAETAHRLGVTTKLDGVPSEGLGGLRLGVSPLEMARAYATLASGGIRHKPIAIRKVKFADGKSDNFTSDKGKRVMTDGEAYEVTQILKKNIQAGTGTKAQVIGCPAAGKTGTTDNFNDAWFDGYTPDLATAVWVGYPNALKEMTNVHGIAVNGGSFPTQIWGEYMKIAKGSNCNDFPQPKVPFKGSAFHGEHSASGKDDKTGGKDNSFTTGGTPGGQNNGGGYDPSLYAHPPQGAPDTKGPKDTKGHGNGNGGGNDTGGGGGNDTGGGGGGANGGNNGGKGGDNGGN
jgi:penicillin-binding protein 1A